MAARHEPFAQIDPVDSDARDHAPVTVAPAAGLGLNLGGVGDPSIEVSPGCFRKRALLRAFSAPAAFWGVDVLDPVAFIPIAQSIAVNNDGLGEHQTGGEEERREHEPK